MSKHTDRLADLESLRARYASLAVDFVSTRPHTSDKVRAARQQLYNLATACRNATQDLIVLEREIGETLDDLQ
jgi:hypothetical protein